jgi:hypothetical protein
MSVIVNDTRQERAGQTGSNWVKPGQNRINREWTRIDANDSGDSPIKPGQTQAIEIDLRLDGVRTNQERPDVRAVSPHRLKLGRDRSAVALRALDKLVWEVDRAEDVVVVLFRCHFFLRL